MNISVCIATYNGERYIVEQLVSILSQLAFDDQVIVSDDCSNDRTIEMIKSLNDARVTVFSNSERLGYTKNFENALKKCSGDVIFLADQDDVWLDCKVQKVMSALVNSDFVVTDCSLTDENLNVTQTSHFKIHNIRSGFLRNLLLPRYVGACMAFKRSVLEFSLPFPKYSQYTPHDYWISLIAESKFNVSLLPEPLMLYRRHGKNASNGGQRSRVPLVRRLAIRLITLYYIAHRLILR
ncbi:alpha-L-Rha alpha-1,3-L-rhamnosyltransferase [Rheinheimera sp. KL1]|uniref:glycosyltransferase family 2 protein n=1 Tax=Rheinheimera sp. KL1 TaxID=1635005 RepID=UPI0006A9AEF2|nr:glycosyltransferase family 2 protein [Rheinheimera sp. KL1]KOO58205.1 alpha-L-Rha alpha-1,3-L-rhamnosyltransferase [Rheinheimera sp. KL1]